MGMLYQSIAKKIESTMMKSYLECDICGRVQTYSEFDFANYLAHGWPICHGHTMRLVAVKAPAK